MQVSISTSKKLCAVRSICCIQKNLADWKGNRGIPRFKLLVKDAFEIRNYVDKTILEQI